MVPQSLASAPDATADPQARRASATAHLRRGAWREALQLFESLADLDLSANLQLRLARNMLALQAHRPAVYQRVLAAPASQRCSLVQVAGQLTIQRHQPDGRRICLSPGGDPRQGLIKMWEVLRPLLDEARPIALCGLADGYALEALGRQEKPARPIAPGLWPCVFLVEPDPEILTHGLMLHDLSGPQGAILQKRFIWCIGPDWRQQMLQALQDDPFLPYPQQVVDLHCGSPELTEGVQAVIEEMNRHEAQQGREVAAAYAKLTAAELLDVLGPAPSRPPRALLLTSRYTTVLQYSTRDMADALEKLGWQTSVCIEPASHHQIPNRAVRSRLLEFRPDVVMTIDHLRTERPNVIPPQLPFVCWIQDDLANLTNAAAGAGIHLRDFILTSSPQSYARHFGYPLRQCLFIGKLTRVPHHARRPDALAADAPDLTFVSNASATPAQMASRFLDGLRSNTALHKLMDQCIQRVIAIYPHDCLHCLSQVRAILADCETQNGGRLRDPVAREELTLWLFNHLNNTLYRQQALRWVASICDRLGLRLGLYGQGWENHPEFARYARGPVAYGPALEELTRRSRINLQLVPFSCLHQRLLDGLVADGFFLIRHHPIDALTRDLAHFLRSHVPAPVNTLAETMPLLSAQPRRDLEKLLRRLAVVVDGNDPDPIANFRRHTAAGNGYLYDTLPGLEETSFNDEAELETRVKKFLNAPQERQRLVAAQRQFVETHHTYEAGMRRIVGAMARLIARENAP